MNFDENKRHQQWISPASGTIVSCSFVRKLGVWHITFQNDNTLNGDTSITIPLDLHEKLVYSSAEQAYMNVSESEAAAILNPMFDEWTKKTKAPSIKERISRLCRLWFARYY